MKNLTVDGEGVDRAENGAAVHLSNCESLHLVDSTFKNLKAQSGGAVYITSSEISKVTFSSAFVFDGSTFIGNEAYRGGAIYADNPSVLNITKSNFKTNKATKNVKSLALEGNGGAVVFTCGSNYLCKSSVTNNTFKENEAEIAGGAFKWSAIEPTFGNNTFDNNTAQKYGDNIAAVSQKLI